jgi:two-component system chemotaxis response regulator CheY
MGKKILAVEDSQAIRQMLMDFLTTYGYEVVTASDGVEALERLNEATVDMVLTDLIMPNMDGLVLAQMIRRQPRFSTLPIVMLTTQDLENLRDAGREAGVNAWLVKPFKPDELLDVIMVALS